MTLPDVVQLACGAQAVPELSFNFVAPEAGTYVFSTFEPAPATDTQLAVINDGGSQSCSETIAVSGDLNQPLVYDAGAVVLTLAEMQSVNVVVEVESGVPGAFALTITQQIPCSGDCCVPHAGPGCSEPAIETCVCDSDLDCCDADSGWSDDCASLARGGCFAGCGI